MKDFILTNLPYIAGGYETLIRLIPTAGKNYSLIHKVLQILGKVINFAQIASNLLNKEKPYVANTQRGAGLILIACIFVFASCKTVQKIDCGSSHNVPVVFHNLTTGSYYTVNVPFCDTVNVTNAPQKVKQ